MKQQGSSLNPALAARDGVRAYPIREAFERIGIKATNGYQLIKDGELETFTIGRFRYCTEAELQRFIQNRIEQARNESGADRARKVRRVVKARSKQRASHAAA